MPRLLGAPTSGGIRCWTRGGIPEVGCFLALELLTGSGTRKIAANLSLTAKHEASVLGLFIAQIRLTCFASILPLRSHPATKVLVNILCSFRSTAPLALLVLASCSGNGLPQPAARPMGDPCAGAWVRLFDDANLSDRQLTLAYPIEQPTLRSVQIDAGAGDLNDRVSSAQWSIPAACKVVLYEDENFRGTAFPLIGSGRVEQNSNLGQFSDKASSARWERS